MENIKPTVTKHYNHSHKETTSTHPAFGTITLSKCQGRNTNLFQSPLKHQSFLRIAINSASVDRHLNRDWVHGNNTLTEFYMSEHQWAMFVSSMGDGSGTPITFRCKPTAIEYVPGIADQDTTFNTHKEEICTSTQKVVDDSKNLKETLTSLYNDKGRASKKDLENLIMQLDVLIGNLPSNMQHIQNSLVKAMDKTITAGKIEVDAYIKTQIQRAGLDAISAQQVPQLKDDRE